MDASLISGRGRPFLSSPTKSAQSPYSLRLQRHGSSSVIPHYSGLPPSPKLLSRPHLRSHVLERLEILKLYFFDDRFTSLNLLWPMMPSLRSFSRVLYYGQRCVWGLVLLGLKFPFVYVSTYISGKPHHAPSLPVTQPELSLFFGKSSRPRPASQSRLPPPLSLSLSFFLEKKEAVALAFRDTSLP